MRTLPVGAWTTQGVRLNPEKSLTSPLFLLAVGLMFLWETSQAQKTQGSPLKGA